MRLRSAASRWTACAAHLPSPSFTPGTRSVRCGAQKKYKHQPGWVVGWHSTKLTGSAGVSPAVVPQSPTRQPGLLKEKPAGGTPALPADVSTLSVEPDHLTTPGATVDQDTRVGPCPARAGHPCYEGMLPWRGDRDSMSLDK